MSKKSSRKKYKYGIAVGNSLAMWKPYLFGGSIEEGIFKTKKWGYEAVELHNISNPKEVDAGEIINTLNKHNIDSASAGAKCWRRSSYVCIQLW